MQPQDDFLWLYGEKFSSRMLLGTALYRSPLVMKQSIEASGTQIITASLRRENSAGADGRAFREILSALKCKILPNTAGCHSVKEAVNTAYMARELFNTDWIKLEVIGHSGTLQPHPFATVEAAKILIQDGFKVFPYITDDSLVCGALLDAGCKILMPWAAPIGTARGVQNPYGLKQVRADFPDIPLIVDAGLGSPSHAVQVMEMGYDAILLNSAVAKSGDSVMMASAFAYGVQAGRLAYHAKIMPPQEYASASSPEFGTAFSPFVG